MWIYKSLIDTWMWKLGMRSPNSFSGNICFEFLALCLCSVSTDLFAYNVNSLFSNTHSVDTYFFYFSNTIFNFYRVYCLLLIINNQWPPAGPDWRAGSKAQEMAAWEECLKSGEAEVACPHRKWPISIRKRPITTRKPLLPIQCHGYQKANQLANVNN